jgi:hypothetical protein
MVAEIRRHETGRDGNLEGLGLVGLTLDGEWVARNEFVGAHLSDDELAIATCLERMASYAAGDGPGFCDLAEGVHDHHLGLTIEAAAESGDAIRVGGHLWDEAS